MLQRTVNLASSSGKWIGASGRCYAFRELLQERPHLGRVWLATCGQDQYVMKDIPKDIWSGFCENIWPRLHDCSNVRIPQDNVPDERILVYKYLNDDFLNLVRKQLPMRSRKQILKATLKGIVELHDRDIVHLDAKPDNIMIDYHSTGKEITVKKVQITDVENAAYLPQGRTIKGMLAGNDNWRSPEGHFKGELSKPSDLFSFGAVCIYAMLESVIFGADDDFRMHVAQGALPQLVRLQRQVSYFGTLDGLNGLMKHVGDEEVNCQVLRMLWEERNEDHIPYRSFRDWPSVSDALFKDLIQGMMNLDPAKRITARQALEHPWFADCDII